MKIKIIQEELTRLNAVKAFFNAFADRTMVIL